MEVFNLLIMTPEHTLYQGEVISALFPGEEGFFEVLAHHAPLIAMVKKGEVVITDKDQKQQHLQIEKGFFEFRENKGLLLTIQ